MLKEESIWIKNIINHYFKEVHFPLLNVGSSTNSFRTIVQPFINENIFFPLVSSGRRVIHSDIKNDEGVEMVGDLNDSNFREKLRNENIKSILCSNLLEHVQKRTILCKSMLDILQKGGLLIITVPKKFPYHKDPIDTMFRPGLKEIHDLFPGTSVLEYQEVIADDNYFKVLKGNLQYLFIMLCRWLMPFYKFHEWKYMVLDLLKMNAHFSATCVLLKKK